jgi:hypothetical protein
MLYPRKQNPIGKQLIRAKQAPLSPVRQNWRGRRERRKGVRVNSRDSRAHGAGMLEERELQLKNQRAKEEIEVNCRSNSELLAIPSLFF